MTQISYPPIPKVAFSHYHLPICSSDYYKKEAWFPVFLLLFWEFICLCVTVSAHLCGAWTLTAGIPVCFSPPYFLNHGLSLSQQLVGLPRLIGQRALLSPPALFQDYKCISMYLAFSVGSGDRTRVFTLAQQAFTTEPSLYLCHSNLSNWNHVYKTQFIVQTFWHLLSSFVASHGYLCSTVQSV